MNWIKKNKDALIVFGVGIVATATVAAVTHKISSDVWGRDIQSYKRIMSLVASDAGVLDKIIEHQSKLESITGK